MAPQRKPQEAARRPKAAGARWTDRTETARRDVTRRRKISTTIAPEGYAFLERLVESGKAANLAEAVDLVLREARKIDNRERLERMTAEAYESMSPEALAETKDLEQALTRSAGEMNIDG